MASAGSSDQILPQLQALLDKAPAGSNPFAYYAQLFSAGLHIQIAEWSTIPFYIIASICWLNVPGTIFTLVLKYKKEGNLAVYKLRDHRDGGRYILLNGTNVFLFLHLITASIFGIYPFLHLFLHRKVGETYMDLSWTALMWLAPYCSLLFSAIGCLYAVLVTPSPLISSRRQQQDLKIPDATAPLAGVPCWLLNAFIFAAPAAVFITILVPGCRLIVSVRSLEKTGIKAWETCQQMAAEYAAGSLPSKSAQVELLQDLAKIKTYGADSKARFPVLFGLWAGWVGVAFILAVISFFVIRRVTKTRLNLAMQQSAWAGDDSGMAETGREHDSHTDVNALVKASPCADIGHSVSMGERSSRGSRVGQARWEHYNLCTQILSGAILLIICFIMLVWDSVRGYAVHEEKNLLAAALIVPLASYSLQSSISVILICIRVKQGKTTASLSDNVNPFGPASSPMRSRQTIARSDSSKHSRSTSDHSTIYEKRSLFTRTITPPVPTLRYGNQPHHQTSNDTGLVYVTAMPKHGFPVSPSLVHQIEISQETRVQVDEELPSGPSVELASLATRRTASLSLPSATSSKDDLASLAR